jgi:hypothetical protein
MEYIIFDSYLATAENDSSTLIPVLAEVSKNMTLYSRAKRSPSSLLTSRCGPQSHLLPGKYSL